MRFIYNHDPLNITTICFRFAVMNNTTIIKTFNNGNIANINRAPDKILGVPGPKKFWMPWGMTQKRKSRKATLAKGDFTTNGRRVVPWPLWLSSSGNLIKTQHCQIMTIITDRIFKLEPVIKKSIVTNHTFNHTVFTFSRINSFAYINFIVI